MGAWPLVKELIESRFVLLSGFVSILGASICSIVGLNRVQLSLTFPWNVIGRFHMLHIANWEDFIFN